MTAPQRQASDPAASAWVTASAGTGKTKVLTDRLVRLMLAGTAPERLLCLTFTKAAAAEMADRLYRRLAAWTALDDGELAKELAMLEGREAEPAERERARRLFALVLEAPGGVKIQTIHAFCQALLGRFPLEARVAPGFAVLDERSAAEQLDAARDRVLAESQRAPASDLADALRQLATLVDERRFFALLATITHERARLQRLIDDGGVAGAIGRVRARLGLDEDETPESVLAAACQDGAFDRGRLRAAAAALAQGSVTDVRRGALIAAWLDADPPARAAGWDDYLAVYFTQKGKPQAHLATKKVQERAPDTVAALGAELSRLEAVRERLKTARVAQSTAALLTVAEALLAAYLGEKRRRGALDYDDLIHAARNLLARGEVAPWVLYKLDGGIDHVLIDEGQDTNPEQWQVVQALTEEFFAGEGAREEGRTVFAVGDAKQSIYSFQRADPDAFEAMRRHYAERVTAARRPWRPVELIESFRSTKAVLDAVDAVFSRDEARDGLFTGAVRHLPIRRGAGGRVELWPPEAPTEPEDDAPWTPPVSQRGLETPCARLARRIAERIRAWLDDGTRLEARGRPIAPGDIMILVQRRAPFVDEVVRALKQRDIPVAGVDRMVLSDQLAVMDLMALGEFLLLPEDDLTLAAVLKSPLIGLDEEELFALAYDRDKRSLWQTLSKRRRERPSFASAHKTLAALMARADYAPPYELYGELLTRGGGRRRLVERLGPEANDPIDEFLNLALAYERHAPPSLQGFLHWARAGATEVRRDLEMGRGEVRVLTVHGAKGLQAPIVILPDTCRVPSQDDALLWLGGGEDEAPLALWPPRRSDEDAVCREAREEARARRRQEYHRLLYVAMTRAEDRLYVCGWEKGGGQGRDKGCWYDLVEAALSEVAAPADLGAGAWGLRLASPQEEAVDLTPPEGEAPPPAAPAWLRRAAPAEPTPPKPLAPSRPESEAPPVQAPLGLEAGAGYRRGRLIHRLLELLPEVPPAGRTRAAHLLIARQAGDLEPAAREALVAETLAVLDDPACAGLFRPESRAEVPLTGIVGGRVVSGQVDRLVVGRHEVVVADYKSNRLPPDRADRVPPVYLRQMAAYRALLEEIYPGRPVRCLLLWTEGPRLMPLDETLLDAAAP